MYIFFLLLKALTKFAFQLFNGIGDFDTIIGALNPGDLPNWDKMTKDEILAKVGGSKNQSFGIKVSLCEPIFKNFGRHHFLWFCK